MPGYDPQHIRNVALISHRGAGKTTLAEAMLLVSGAIEKMGTVEAGNTVCDFDAAEASRQVSVFNSLCYAEWSGHKVNLLDTPGYADFAANVIAATRVVEGAVVVVDAVGGVEVQTEAAWEYAERQGLPCLIFVNKTDKENASFARALASIAEGLSNKAAPLVIPWGEQAGLHGVVDVLSGKAYVRSGKNETEQEAPQEMAEAVASARERLLEASAEAVDELTEKYLEAGDLTPQEMLEGLRQGVRQRVIFPVIAGSATSAVGASRLLEAIRTLLPSPAESALRRARKVDGSGEVELRTDASQPCRAVVMRTVVDPYVGKFSLLRVFSGALAHDMQVLNSTRGERERIGQPLLVQGKEQQATPRIVAGDMGAMAKLTATSTFDTLCEEPVVIVPAPVLPEPVFSASVTPESRADEEKLSTALAKVAEEDICFAYHREEETGETVISGGGQLHLDIVVDRLRAKYKVAVRLGAPKVAYRETITKRAEAQGRHKKQTGGRGQFGDIYLRLEPLPGGGGFEFHTEIRGGEVPSNYFPAVEKGVREAMKQGALARYPVTDVKVTLYKGSHHPVDSSDLAFQIAGSIGFRAAMQEAGPVLLEPIVAMEALVPEEQMGDVMGVLNSKRARILGMEAQRRSQLIKTLLPAVELASFAVDLRSITQGRGSFTARFSHYEEVPPQLAEGIMKERQREREEES